MAMTRSPCDIVQGGFHFPDHVAAARHFRRAYCLLSWENRHASVDLRQACMPPNRPNIKRESRWEFQLRRPRGGLPFDIWNS